MKRYLIVLCALLTIGCSKQAATSPTPVSSVAASSFAANQESSVPSSQQSGSNSESSPKLGSRKNAAKINDKITSTIDDLAQFEITLVEIKRGKDALAAIMKENEFNDLPTEGNEYILATFKIKNIKDLSRNDSPLGVWEYDFSFSDSQFAKSDLMPNAVYSNPLYSELYEGAETTGNVLFECQKNDSPYAVYLDTIWFNISGE
ncbi:MAG: hypothetical protein VB035_01380 [Candidatus Fimivivens sp.]|nr:hypothetical protein [Candidatus Fimivivens sp.]